MSRAVTNLKLLYIISTEYDFISLSPVSNCFTSVEAVSVLKHFVVYLNFKVGHKCFMLSSSLTIQGLLSQQTVFVTSRKCLRFDSLCLNIPLHLHSVHWWCVHCPRGLGHRCPSADAFEQLYRARAAPPVPSTLAAQSPLIEENKEADSLWFWYLLPACT